MKNIKKIVWWILLIGLMIIIYNFSAEKAVDSADTSKSFIKMLIDIIPFSKNLSDATKQEVISSLNFIIRKCAHFTLYALLGFLAYGAVKSTFSFSEKSYKKYSFVICVVYAIFDEIHQYFVPGRACRLYDIVIDGLGAVFGIFIFNYIGKRIKKLYTKHKKC